jgi:hypothetical protein
MNLRNIYFEHLRGYKYINLKLSPTNLGDNFYPVRYQVLISSLDIRSRYQGVISGGDIRYFNSIYKEKTVFQRLLHKKLINDIRSRYQEVISGGDIRYFYLFLIDFYPEYLVNKLLNLVISGGDVYMRYQVVISGGDIRYLKLFDLKFDYSGPP